MSFVGWLFLISGIISAFFVPVIGIPSIVIGVLLLLLGRKGKYGRYRYKEEKYKLKAEEDPENAEKYLRKARKSRVKATKFER